MQTRKLAVLGFLVFAVVLMSPGAFAGQATVTNNGSNPMVLNIKVNGQRQFPSVEPGQTFTVPEGATKVGFLTEGDVTITRGDGTTATYRGQRPPTTSVEGSSSSTVVRTGESTTVVPSNGGVVNFNGLSAGYDFGAGLGPAASDPPVQYPAIPAGIDDQTYNDVLDELDNASSDADVDRIQSEHGLSDAEMAYMIAEYEMELFDYFSGSGGTFGDCVGTNCQIGVNTPGYPRFGPPIGSWAHFVPGRTSIATDSSLIDSFLQGGVNDSSFQSNFESLYGASPRLDF